jgi:hypothetical protein
METPAISGKMPAMLTEGSNAMERSELYIKLLSETAKIRWSELEKLFSGGALLHLAPDLDLVGVAEAVASDGTEQVGVWANTGALAKMSVERSADYAARDAELWAVVVSPWVIVQERRSAPTAH